MVTMKNQNFKKALFMVSFFKCWWTCSLKWWKRIDGAPLQLLPSLHAGKLSTSDSNDTIYYHLPGGYFQKAGSTLRHINPELLGNAGSRTPVRNSISVLLVT